MLSLLTVLTFLMGVLEVFGLFFDSFHCFGIGCSGCLEFGSFDCFEWGVMHV